MKDVSVNFTENTQPFSPLEQTIATFSPQDAEYLPTQWRNLILDKNSPIIDFYPTDFKIDFNGKREKWQGVALLPFVDEERLLQALKPVYSTLTQEEEKRNRRDYASLFVHSTNSCYKQLKKLYGNNRNEITQNNPVLIEINLSNRMAGQIWPDGEERIRDIGEEIIAPIPNNQVICVKYRDP
jgi:5'-3' exoribonuclease 2